MAIQVVHVTNPVAGAEWQYTIPGQYNVTLIGVQATLTTTAPPTTAVDSSGAGLGATYNETFPLTFGVTGPFGGGGGRAVDINPGINQNSDIATFPNGAGQLDFATFTYEILVNLRTSGVGSFETLLGIQSGSGPVRDQLMAHASGGSATIGYGYSGNNANFPGGSISRGAWHQVALTYDGTTWRPYADGAALVTSTTGAPDLTVVDKPFYIAGNNASGSNIFNGAAAAASVYNSVLSAARIAAHNTAIATSAAAYKAAVLADSPAALWMLDDALNTSPRTVTLAVQNGAATVATFPTDVPVVAPGVFTYSWQTLGPGAAQSVDGTLITVPIPTMTLPPGYTVGSNTPDIASTDQWSSVTLWYDDGTGTPNPAGQEPPYLNALLVPTTWAGVQ